LFGNDETYEKTFCNVPQLFVSQFNYQDELKHPKGWPMQDELVGRG